LGSVKTIGQITDPVDYFGTRRYLYNTSVNAAAPQDSLPTIEWGSPNAAHMSDAQREEILAAARLDVKSVPPVAPDPYAFGKAFARLARIGKGIRSVTSLAACCPHRRRCYPHLVARLSPPPAPPPPPSDTTDLSAPAATYTVRPRVLSRPRNGHQR
jgi:hypothetical protein